MQGWPYKRIAAEMNIHWHTVMTHATKIYQQHGVHGRYELARKLRVPLERPVTMKEEVLRRVKAGEDAVRIAREMGIGRNVVSAYKSDFRRKGIVVTVAARASAPLR